MLDIESKFPLLRYAYGGSGIFDVAKNIIQKSSNSAIAKKVLNSATAKNLKRAADSAVGQEIKKSVLSGVSEASKNAAEGAFEKLGLPVSKKRRKKSNNKKKKGTGIVYD
jgi:hypothetical protein